MSKIKKVMTCEIKQVGEEKDRILRFIGSDETADRDRDIIEYSGWQLEEYKANPVFLWAHEYDTPPVGKAVKVSTDVDKRALVFDIKFPTLEELSSDVSNPSEHAKFTDTIYNLYKGGYLSATSVGFRGLEFKRRDDADAIAASPDQEWRRGTRYMKQSLLELSGVPVPSNPNALQQAKSAGITGIEEVEAVLAEIETRTEATLSLDESITKLPSPDGDPSCYDIEKAIYKIINPSSDYCCGSWIVDLYPKNYPNGQVIVCKQDKLFIYAYEYTKIDDRVEITLGVGKEIDLGYNEKTLQERRDHKTGASISAKNRALLASICEAYDGNTAKLKEFLQESMPMVPEETGTATRTAPTTSLVTQIELSPELKQTLDELKIKLDTLSEKKTDALESSREEKEPDNFDIKLDEIEFPKTEKIAAVDELDIEPEELKNMITSIIEEQIKGVG